MKLNITPVIRVYPKEYILPVTDALRKGNIKLKALESALSGVPNAASRTTATITLVRLPSSIELKALLKPCDTAPSMVFPFLNSSLIRSAEITLASTPKPIESMIPAIPGNVIVKLGIPGKNPEMHAIIPAA